MTTKQFIKLLSACAARYSFHVTPSGSLRGTITDSGTQCSCCDPITAVYHYIYGIYWSVFLWRTAASLLHLSDPDAIAITSTADNRTFDSHYSSTLRSQLLAAIGEGDSQPAPVSPTDLTGGLNRLSS